MRLRTFTIFLPLLLFIWGPLSAQNPGHLITYQPFSPCVGSPVLFNAVDTSGLYSQAWLYWDFGDGGFASATSANPGASHIYTSPGTYWVNFGGFDSLSFASDSVFFQITVDSTCSNHDLISGVVYLDANGNGVQDAGEVPFPNRTVVITPGPYTFTSDQNGGFGINLPPGNYTFTPQPPAYFNVSQPSAGSYTVTSTGTGQVLSGNDFGLAPVAGINDLRVTGSSIPPVPGFDRTYTFYYENLGTTAQTATLTFNHDPQLTYLGADNGGTYSNNTVTWNLGLLLPGDVGIVRCSLNVPIPTVVGSFLFNYATIDPIAGDTTPENNIDSLNQEVVASYDPNDKQAVPMGQGVNGDINPGTDLTYTIRFQNTGNFMATNVVLRDTLDPDFDWASLKVLGGSHPMTWYLNNGELVFRFDNINLPDSNSNEPASHGWAKYQISHPASLPLGTELTNTAHIYFDFNAPIVTNTTLHTLNVVTSVEGPDQELTLTIAPNPFQDQTRITFDNPEQVAHTFVVRDLQGKEVSRLQGLTGTEFLFDRQQLPAGLYLFDLSNQQGTTATGKLIIQ